MKSNKINLYEIQGINELTMTQLISIEGGSFWFDAAYAVCAAAHAILTFAQDAAAYQTSLPSYDKK
ncbi:MAG: hypothetical protein ABUT20_38855 [Bacteroidota bacterium]